MEQKEAVPRSTRGRHHPQVDISALEWVVRPVLHIEHYALKTEKTYLYWIQRFVAYYYGKRPRVVKKVPGDFSDFPRTHHPKRLVRRSACLKSERRHQEKDTCQVPPIPDVQSNGLHD